MSHKNVKGDEIYPYAEFRFNFINSARNIANKPFSLKKVAGTGLNYKPLENISQILN